MFKTQVKSQLPLTPSPSSFYLKDRSRLAAFNPGLVNAGAEHFRHHEKGASE